VVPNFGTYKCYYFIDVNVQEDAKLQSQARYIYRMSSEHVSN